ncbi:trypsin-like peptidase domain-containing protein [Pedobacter africanus]|uniref:Serine protease Do n=1 Tax=Pedobacter africanus TaxID=151894 RepID=A0A1W2E914_9SPHI|nr:trypsin-like peptidase domain-containing protein [Pedobacter africanus]SMD05548.1 serine protease Do [Pedobacter africanus]
MKKLSFLFLSLLFTLQIFAQTGNFDFKKLEKDIRQVVQRAYDASVYITPYDSVSNRPKGGSFSGVVIDTTGHVLSAAHAVKPGDLYEITFPDGKKFKAVGLGRIPRNDAAMLKIKDKGSWPYTPMGWSSSLKKDMPCVSIAYPGTVGAKTPTIRLGYIAETETKEGFIRSTCLMEPGDSGGPVFDMKGRVIGLHSKIDLSLDDNFEIPVDLYRKYWNALTKPASYAERPEATIVPEDPQARELKDLPEITQLNVISEKLNERLNKTSFKLKSTSGGTELQILGTLVKPDGFLPETALKNKSFLLSKSSMVGDNPILELSVAKSTPAKVIRRDEANDLVLLQVDHKLKDGIALGTIAIDSVVATDLGKLLTSPQPGNRVLVSILGNTPISIAKGPNPAFIGIGTDLKDGKVVIVNIQPRSPASTAALETGDEVLSFNGKPILKAEDLSKEMAAYKPNDTVNLQLSRAGVPFFKRIALKPRRMAERHIAYRFTDGRSERRTDFGSVLIHDGKLKPSECGGPLYGIDGRFYGVNIARLSRTSSLAIPAAIIQKFVKQSLTEMKEQAMLNYTTFDAPNWQ